MLSNATETIKISKETKEILQQLKEEQGIEFKFAVDNAIKKVYGQKNSN